MEIEEFTKRMRVRARNVDDRRHQLLRRVALAVDQAVVMATPVDTGRARANWVVRAGDEPFNGTVDDIGPGAASGQQALEQGRDVIRNIDPAVRTIHITNNLPYINRLNEGWSEQAPAGFVEEAVAAGVQAVREARLVDE